MKEGLLNEREKVESCGIKVCLEEEEGKCLEKKKKNFVISAKKNAGKGWRQAEKEIEETKQLNVER